jgi:hypothetical protein
MGVEVPIGALRPFSGHWWIAGGWAVDLFLGEQTRVHDDVDVAVLRRDEHELVELVGAERVGEISCAPTGSTCC